MSETKIWNERQPQYDPGILEEKFALDKLSARILANRGISPDKVSDFLRPSLDQMHDEHLMNGVDEAAQIIHDLITENKKIRVIGDYDVDGITSTYILVKALEKCSGSADNISWAIPDRVKDGYGLNIRLIEEACSDQIDAIITCDNGVAAYEPVHLAKEKGMTVIVTDHHEIKYEKADEGSRIYRMPEADVVIDPHRPDDSYPFKQICGAVVAWKLMMAVYPLFGIDREEAVMDYRDVASLATVADVMDIVDENRAIVKSGLQAMKHTKNLGLQTLMEIIGVQPDDLNVHSYGFRIGPCLNAAGRLKTADMGLKLLLETNRTAAKKEASELNSLNIKRRMLTEEGLQSALEQIKQEGYENDKVLVIYVKGVIPGVIGLIAGKLQGIYNRPVFVMSESDNELNLEELDVWNKKDAKTDSDEKAEESAEDTETLSEKESDEGSSEENAEIVLKGSGRSIPAYIMYEKMQEADDAYRKEYPEKNEGVFTAFGGHPMAAGFSIKKENLKWLRSYLNEHCDLTDDDITPVTEIDAYIRPDEVTEAMVKGLKRLEPFGNGFDEPVLATDRMWVHFYSKMGRDRQYRNAIIDNNSKYSPYERHVKAVYFKDSDELDTYLVEKYGPAFQKCLDIIDGTNGRMNRAFRLSVTYYPILNTYNGRTTIEARIEDYK